MAADDVTELNLTLHVAEGIDQFRAEGRETLVLKLYNDWLERVDRKQREAQQEMERLTRSTGMGPMGIASALKTPRGN